MQMRYWFFTTGFLMKSRSGGRILYSVIYAYRASADRVVGLPRSERLVFGCGHNFVTNCAKNLQIELPHSGYLLGASI